MCWRGGGFISCFFAGRFNGGRFGSHHRFSHHINQHTRHTKQKKCTKTIHEAPSQCFFWLRASIPLYTVGIFVAEHVMVLSTTCIFIVILSGLVHFGETAPGLARSSASSNKSFVH
ncbi:hypothetical protein J3E68DRAFT_390260 [Trichoderma sp. SZMC 28012]